MEAEPLCRRSLAIREKHRGLHHPEVATGLDNLARVLCAQVRMGKLESFVVCVSDSHLVAHEPFGLRGGLVKMPVDRPFQIKGLSILCPVFLAPIFEMFVLFWERFVKAETLYRRFVVIVGQKRTSAHPLVTNNMDNVAYMIHT